MSQVEDIGSVLKYYVAKSEIGKKLKRYRIFNHWPEIVGREISNKTNPEKLIRGILYISVASSTWANEMSMMSRKLVEKINNYIGEDIVKELRFKIQQ
jgi:predicted nucleic acid-binding Zn ribbon protein